jgi:hypothetical protein
MHQTLNFLFHEKIICTFLKWSLILLRRNYRYMKNIIRGLTTILKMIKTQFICSETIEIALKDFAMVMT